MAGENVVVGKTPSLGVLIEQFAADAGRDCQPKTVRDYRAVAVHGR